MGSLTENPLDVLDHGLSSSLGLQAVSINEGLASGMQEMDVERDCDGRRKRSDPFKFDDFPTRRQERDWLVRLVKVRNMPIDFAHPYSV